MKSVVSFRPMRSSAGLRSMEVKGIMCCTSWNLFKQVCQSPSMICQRKSFAVCTMRSAWPLVVGWKGVERMWQILFLVVKFRNSPKVKAVPVSETRMSGRPWVTNNFLRAEWLLQKR